MKIFIVEDDTKLNHTITTNLELLGYNVASYTDGQKAFNSISLDYKFYLIDITLPNINGLELVRQIKLINIHAKVFIMSAHTDIDTILKAYDLGCDDYIKKPFDLREIVVKIQKISSLIPDIIKLSSDCNYDMLNKVLFYKNQEVMLTNKEVLLLDILVLNLNKIVSSEEIETYVWGETIGSGHVRQLVSKLRKSLPYNTISNAIGNGYKFEKRES